MKGIRVFPGKITVSFRRGSTGFLIQEPSEEAMQIKKNKELQDQTPPIAQDKIREKARDIVFMRGGDVSDRQEVLGEYVIQFGQYKGKSFRWMLENDVSYTLFWIQKVEEEERAGLARGKGPKKDSILSFYQYAKSFKAIEDLIRYKADRPSELSITNEDDNLVGFGKNAKKTWREVWDNRADGYAAFIRQAQCVKGTRMHALQQYLAKKYSTSVKPAPAPAATTAIPPPPATATAAPPAPAPAPAPAQAPAVSHLPGLLTMLLKMSVNLKYINTQPQQELPLIIQVCLKDINSHLHHCCLLYRNGR